MIEFLRSLLESKEKKEEAKGTVENCDRYQVKKSKASS